MAAYSDEDLKREDAMTKSSIQTSGHVSIHRDEGEVAYQPSSVDLHLGDEFAVMEAQNIPVRLDDPSTYPEYDFYEDHSKFVIEPFEFVLATTQEVIELDETVKGTLWGRSSVGRLGIFVHTAGLADSGFSGDLTLELFNCSPVPYTLEAGMRIVQMTVHELKNPSSADYDEKEGSKYQDQSGVTPSKLHEDY